MYYAICNGRIGIIKYLIEECKVNPNNICSYEYNPLHIALNNDHL